MQVVTKYLAFDGTLCSTKEACLAYEFRLKLVKIIHTEWDALCRLHTGPIPLETAISFFQHRFTLTPNEAMAGSIKKLEDRIRITKADEQPAHEAERASYTLDPVKEQ